MNKTEKRKRLQEMLRGGPLDSEFLEEIFGQHPGVHKRRALGKEVVEYYVAYAGDGFPGKHHGNCFWAHWSDGERARMSIDTALKGKYRTPLDLFTIGARAAIESQILEFRDNCTENRCAISGEIINGRNTDVDHAYPKTFSALRDAFIRETGLDLEKIGLRDDDGKPRIAHPVIRDMWCWYHKKHAVLRLTLTSENRRAGNRSVSERGV